MYRYSYVQIIYIYIHVHIRIYIISMYIYVHIVFKTQLIIYIQMQNSKGGKKGVARDFQRSDPNENMPRILRVAP